jgi:hypothetical protein
VRGAEGAEGAEGVEGADGEGGGGSCFSDLVGAADPCRAGPHDDAVRWLGLP